MATMNVCQSDAMKNWVAQGQGGRYINASDYVRDLIRRDQERQATVAEPQRLVTASIEVREPKERKYTFCQSVSCLLRREFMHALQ